MYTDEELASIHFMYGLADVNALETGRFYREPYATRRLPDYVNTGISHVHQAPGDGQEVQPLRRRMFSTQ
jgi:hypothetical protein